MKRGVKLIEKKDLHLNTKKKLLSDITYQVSGIMLFFHDLKFLLFYE